MPRKAHLNFRCIEVEQSKKWKMVCFSISANQLWKIVKINQRDPDKDQGYQRTLSPSRVNAIARYIDQGHTLPNTILISLDSSSKVLPSGEIQIPNREDAGWVIDGQHRLAGAKEAQRDIELAVMAFIGLDVDEQIRQFVVINREAKGVPTSLYYDLLKYLPPNKSDADRSREKAADIANSLKKDEESPFFGKVVISSPRRGELSLNNFVRKVAPLLRDKSGKFHTYTQHEQLTIINNFYKGLRNVFPQHFQLNRPTLMKTLGFGAMMNALPTVFDITLKNHSGFTLEDIVKVLERVAHFDFGAWDNYGTGNEAETQAGEDFRIDLLRAFEEGTDTGVIRL